MLLVARAPWAGVVFLLLTTWISGPRPTPLAAAELSKEAPAVAHPTDVNKMQQTLLDKGHYRGKVDGVFGLRSRASIRAYQKAEHLRVTGKLDVQTSAKLGVTPEVREETGSKTAQDKPSAGIKWAHRSRRPSRTRTDPADLIAISPKK
jgi:peptidoglycan hydrolase-like protein with peptidoglycan-binding domain